MKTTRTLLLLGLVATLNAGTGLGLNAAERAVPTPPAPAQVEPSALLAKIVAVDKSKKTITVDIKGRVFVFKLSPELSVQLQDKVVPADALAPGQTISLIARRSATGTFEVVSLNIQPNPEAVAVAGPSRGAARANDKAGPKKPAPQLSNQLFSLPVPFRTEPNPANYSGDVVSPN